MNHSNTIEQFFALIRSGLWGGKAASSPFDGGADWEALLRLASMQSLTGIFADGAGTLPRELMPPAETARRLFVTVESIRRANRRLDAVLAELEAGLRREGIEGILLKGQGVARAYLCGDIDLYPGKGDAYLRCCEIVRSLGESEGREDESEKHFHFNRRGCSIEIHSHVMLAADPFVNRRLQRWTDEMLDDPSKLRHVEINGVEVNLPPVDFDAVFILQHIANHLLKGGIGLRQLCDWSRYLHVHAAEIDRARLGNNLRTLRLMNCWQLFGWLAVNRLGLPEAEMPFYSPRHEKRALRCLRIILRKGNFGHYDKAARRNLDINFILRKMQTCLIVIGQHAELLRVIPAEVLRHLPWYLLDGIKRLFNGIKRLFKGK